MDGLVFKKCKNNNIESHKILDVEETNVILKIIVEVDFQISAKTTYSSVTNNIRLWYQMGKNFFEE